MTQTPGEKRIARDNRLDRLKREMLVEYQTRFRDKLFAHDYLSQLIEQETFNIQVNSPEEFRTAIIEFCSLAAYKLREIGKHLKHKDKKQIEQELRSYEMIAKFWGKVRINVRE